jgi:hypothetical protein
MVLLVAFACASVAVAREISFSGGVGHQLVWEGAAGVPDPLPADPFSPQGSSIFPLQVSSNGRYLEDASGNPWLMVGDSPQSVAGNLSVPNADAYFSDRQLQGFNAVWINLLCGDYTGCASTGETYDGVAPFMTGTDPGSYDLSTPNSAYFDRVHQMIADAAAGGIEVVLDPIETGACIGGSDSWSQTLVNNGDRTLSTTDKDYRYGEYLGTEFGDLKNVLWMSGNDFQCIHTATDVNNDALSVAAGIRATDPGALQSSEADFCQVGGGFACQGSSSLTDSAGNSTGWASTVNLNAAYTYSPTYAEDRAAYSQTPTMPVFLAEANYEGQRQGNTDGCLTIRNCRLQEWWTMTSGATGQLYGGPSYPITNSTTLASIDTTAVTQLRYVTQLMDQIAWQGLVPDTGNAVVTSGFGTCPTSSSIVAVTCVTTASDYNGTAGSATEAVSYLPDPSTFASPVVNLADFAGPVTAQWYDPTNGTFMPVSGSPFTNRGSQTITPTTNNSAGDKDWVLLLRASPPVFTVAVTNPGAQSGTVGSAQDLQINATDSGGVAVKYAATGLPAGLAIDAGSGLISGTPTSPGTSTVTVSVTDGLGNTGSTQFTWTITAPTPTTTATTPSTTTPSTTTPSTTTPNTTTPTPTTPTTTTAPSTPPASLPATPLAPVIGRPKVTSVSLRGVAHGTPKLGLSVIAGANAAALKAISIALPSGLQFSKQLKRGVSATAAFKGGLQAGKLTLSLRSPVRRIAITIAGPALTANAALVTRAHRRRLGKLRLAIGTTDASDTRFTATVEVTDKG